MKGLFIPALLLLLTTSAFVVILVASKRGVGVANTDAIEQRVYDRLVLELAQELEPVYADFGIAAKARPKTIGEVIRPLLGVRQAAIRVSPENDRNERIASTRAN